MNQYVILVHYTIHKLINLSIMYYVPNLVRFMVFSIFMERINEFWTRLKLINLLYII